MSIELESLSKLFAGHRVVSDLSLKIPEGELFVLLGPSGSGKSTVLRLIAGLLEADGGRILLRGRDVSGLPPKGRGVGFVFQHYALFRHMTVAENIEFALRIRKVDREDRRRRREELLELVGLVGLGGRMPHQLSGGQQQRVALARALAHRPEVLLLDEPFGALDAKIRSELRRSLRRIQAELGVTTLFVTHDQEEGFELADRLGVMHCGRLLEVGPPQELYSRPRTEFVASFLGKANLLVGECEEESVRLGPLRLPLDGKVRAEGPRRRVQVLFRPEDVTLDDPGRPPRWPALGTGVVEERDFSGSSERLRLRLPHLAGVRPVVPGVRFGSDDWLVEALRSQHSARAFPLAPGDPVLVGVRRIHALLHPGLHLLMVLDGSERSERVLALGAEAARLAHARVTVLALADAAGAGPLLEAARQRLAGGPASLDLLSAGGEPVEAVLRELDRQPYDLVVYDRPQRELLDFSRRLLDGGEHHLLRAGAEATPPARVLICVAVGEPGKEDLAFAGRLVRHFGASASILTVLPTGASEDLTRQGHRFLEAGSRTLAALDVPSRTLTRSGQPVEEIRRYLAGEEYGLLVLGAPLPGRDGQVALGDVTGELLGSLGERSILIVRTHLQAALEEAPAAGQAVA